LLFLYLAAAPAVAQDDETIDEIQVTATRRLINTENVSAALTLASRRWFPAEQRDFSKRADTVPRARCTGRH